MVANSAEYSDVAENLTPPRICCPPPRPHRPIPYPRPPVPEAKFRLTRYVDNALNAVGHDSNPHPQPPSPYCQMPNSNLQLPTPLPRTLMRRSRQWDMTAYDAAYADVPKNLLAGTHTFAPVNNSGGVVFGPGPLHAIYQTVNTFS